MIIVVLDYEIKKFGTVSLNVNHIQEKSRVEIILASKRIPISRTYRFKILNYDM